MAYLGQADLSADVQSALGAKAQPSKTVEYDALKQSNGSENPYRLHAELADMMWNNCGIWRVQKDLLAAQRQAGRAGRSRHQCDLVDDSGWNNQAVPFTRAVINMIEQSKGDRGRRHRPRRIARRPLQDGYSCPRRQGTG